MLEADETRQIFQAELLAGWRSSVGRLSRADTAGYYKNALQGIRQPVLREFVEYRLNLQTLLAALRIRQAGGEPQRYPGGWGIGRWVKHIEMHWDAADFRLGALYPWISEAGNHLAAADAIALDRLLMDTLWRKLSRLGDLNPFGFEAITAFVFKWDIAQAWLLRDAGVAKQRFQILIDEVKHVQ
ncbi:DUF2764 family protein [Methylomonas sp. LL1]|nr:DUF2764 family protein [Methylomonas sp. LL1]